MTTIYDTDTCGICRDTITTETQKVLQCGHVFHTECIDEWAARIPICPFCRKIISGVENTPLQYALVLASRYVAEEEMDTIRELPKLFELRTTFSQRMQIRLDLMQNNLIEVNTIASRINNQRQAVKAVASLARALKRRIRKFIDEL